MKTRQWNMQKHFSLFESIIFFCVRRLRSLQESGNQEVCLLTEKISAMAEENRKTSDQLAEARESLEAMSAARQVTASAPPFLLIHGDADLVVPLQQSERLVSELQKNKISVELIVKRGGGHPWLTIHEEVAKLADWFDRRLIEHR